MNGVQRRWWRPRFPPSPPRPRPLPLAMALVVGGGVLASCGRSGSPASALAHTGPIQVVAAENFWGSIATQVGGARAQVRSLISDPSADPHQFEVSSADARLFAQASLVIANG